MDETPVKAVKDKAMRKTRRKFILIKKRRVGLM